MRYLTICIFLLVACDAAEDENTLREQVMETDRSFNKMATEKGNAHAFLYYADEMVIKMRDGDYPLIGKFAMMESFKENPWDDLKLTWEPLRAEASGNIGYTYGTYVIQAKTNKGSDTTFYGNYVSVWKRKRDGSWRYVVDGGGETPGPVSLKK